LRHHIEIRGLGVLDLRELFGIAAVRDRKRVNLVVHLCDWTEGEEFDRLGLEDRFHTILGTPIRELRVPVRPGRDMGTIIEMAARNELLRRDGRHTAKEFLGRIESQMTDPPPRPPDEAVTAEAQRRRLTWSSMTPNAGASESSAWIPAVRPTTKEDE
jgi:HPr kinase/phosphorylase